MERLVDIVNFKIVASSSVTKFLEASEKMTNNFLKKQNGFVSRQILQSEDNWADIVLWESQDAAMNAAQIMCENPSCGEFMAFLDQPSVTAQQFKIKQDFK